MVEIDPDQKKYIVRFKPKEQRENRRDDKVEIFRAILGIADTNNILEITKESDVYISLILTLSDLLSSFTKPFKKLAS